MLTKTVSLSVVKLIPRSAIGARAFTTTAEDCEPIRKLRSVLEEYRQQNFSRETPSRFKKELIKAVVKSDDVVGDGMTVVAGLNRILVNIGHPEALLSDDEAKTLVNDSRVTMAKSLPTSQLIASLI